MEYASAIRRIETFVGAAALAAHASFFTTGFRQRDVRFFSELFINWAQDLIPKTDLIQNTQLARYLSALVKDGYAKNQRGASPPVYRLTRLGLLEILTRITACSDTSSPGEFLFALGFLQSYRDRLQGLVEQEGPQFPNSLKLELSALLATDELLRKEISRVDRAIARLSDRVHDALETSELTRNRLAAGVAFNDIVREAERRFPYELNSMKPLSELIGTLVPDQQRWELEHGNALRVTVMWRPQLRMLQEYRSQLETLRAAR